MFSIVFSAWQQMLFTGQFLPGQVIEGYLVLLTRLHSCSLSRDGMRITQQSNDGSDDPFKTNVFGVIRQQILDGEIAILQIESELQIAGLVKLPCGTNSFPFENGVTVEMSGELQLQVKPEIEALPRNLVKLKILKPPLETSLGDLIITVQVFTGDQ